MAEDDGEGENDGRVKYCAALLRQFHKNALCVPRLFKAFPVVEWDRIPPLNINESDRHEPKSWKESYIMAEIDSRRTVMSSEEFIQFRWQLIYEYSPSRMGMGRRQFNGMGLRQFNEDGTYSSSFMGMSEWVLQGNVLRLFLRVGSVRLIAGMELLVEKDAITWGWIIGKGQATTYYSVVEEGHNRGEVARHAWNMMLRKRN